MSNIGNENILQIDQLRGQTISSLDEVTTIANSFNTVYLLVSINNDNISTSKKISLKNLLTVLINDSDNISSVFNNFFDTFSATTDSYIRVDKNSVTGAKEITLSTINTGAETESMLDFNANIENDALVTTSTLRKFVKYIESFLNNLSIEGSTPELLNIVKDFSDLNVEPDESQFKFTLQLAEYDETTGEISDGLITRESLMTILQHTTSNITIDTAHNSIVTGNKTYRLTLNEQGQLGFSTNVDNYSAITLTLYQTESSYHFERDANGGTLTLKAKPSKQCTSRKWNNELSQAQTFSANAVIDGTGTYSSNEAKSFSLSVTEILTQEEQNNGHTNPASKTVNVSTAFDKYRVWVFTSNSSNFEVQINNYKPSNLPSTILYDDATTSTPNINVSTSSAYIYILIMNAWNTKQFYFGGSNFPETPVKMQENLSIYSNSTTTERKYTLYRSVNQQTKFEYK